MIYKKKITLGKNRYLVVDLTKPLDLNDPVYPGDPIPQKIIFSDIHKKGWQHHIYHLGDHVFKPHGDAPSHQNKELQGQGFETFDLDWSFNMACLVDLSSSSGVIMREGISYLPVITTEHLTPFAAALSSCGAVVLRTGYDLYLEQNKALSLSHLPFLQKEAAQYLASFPNLKVVGIDSLSFDSPGSQDSHHFLKDRFLVESLVHLNQIPREAQAYFSLMTSAVRIVGATGGPVVAYAFIELPESTDAAPQD